MNVNASTTATSACVTHCCARHGCKYSMPTCVVYTRVAAQQHPCEQCEDMDPDSSAADILKVIASGAYEEHPNTAAVDILRIVELEAKLAAAEATIKEISEWRYGWFAFDDKRMNVRRLDAILSKHE